jgi:uncharacterized paraquat-inducible protein A
MVIVVKTVNKCPFCGCALELVEFPSHIWFGCIRCMRYVKREKRQIMRKFVDYRKRKFKWRQMMSELYYIYRRYS